MNDPLVSAVLCWARGDDVAAAEALSAAAANLGSGGVALLYSATACTVAAIQQEGRLFGPKGALSLDGVFEIRAFGSQAELRWLQTGGERGRAVLLYEQAAQVTAPEDWAVRCSEGELDRLPGQYVLWGPGADKSPAPGWSTLAEARIGVLDVPVADVGIKHVCLRTVEYLQVEDEHGNVGVLDERLTGLEVL